jgi:hypothetical protein
MTPDHIQNILNKGEGLTVEYNVSKLKNAGIIVSC